MPEFIIETVVSEDVAENTVAAIEKTAKAGKIGDGKFVVLLIESAVRIRTDETGCEAR